MNYQEMIAEILQGTNNGDDLHLIDREVLDFISDASPSEVTEMDEVAFYELCARVRKGYRPPWFHGLENLTINRVGFVSWRGRQVEHYDLPGAFEARTKVRAQRLAEGCQELERLGKEVCEGSLWQLWDGQRTTLTEA